MPKRNSAGLKSHQANKYYIFLPYTTTQSNSTALDVWQGLEILPAEVSKKRKLAIILFQFRHAMKSVRALRGNGLENFL